MSAWPPLMGAWPPLPHGKLVPHGKLGAKEYRLASGRVSSLMFQVRPAIQLNPLHCGKRQARVDAALKIVEAALIKQVN